MTKIPFQVSAKTARLIGRENVANADGAVIELVKNGYDVTGAKVLDVLPWIDWERKPQCTPEKRTLRRVLSRR